MRPRLYNVFREQIHGPVVRHHVHAVENGLVDKRNCLFNFRVRVRVDELERSRLGVRNVEAIKLKTPFPFLIFDPFWNQFQRSPGRGQRDMQFRLCIRLDEDLARAPASFCPSARGLPVPTRQASDVCWSATWGLPVEIKAIDANGTTSTVQFSVDAVEVFRPTDDLFAFQNDKFVILDARPDDDLSD